MIPTFLRTLWATPPDSDVVGINRRNVELVYAHNTRVNYRFADDKLLTKQCLQAGAVPVPETLYACEHMRSVEDMLDALEERSEFVVKPASSSGGNGIIVLGARTQGGWLRSSGVLVTRDALRQHLANTLYGAFSGDTADRAYAEVRVRAHALLHALFSEGLCDIRVITLHTQPLMAMLRVPTRQSDGRANLHQGALGLAVDLGKGVVTRAVHKGRAITTHPDTGQTLIGFELPSWQRVLDVARRAAGSVPLGYLGVDVVVDEAGQPLVLEVNARPGLEIQNVNARGIGAALATLGGSAP